MLQSLQVVFSNDDYAQNCRVNLGDAQALPEAAVAALGQLSYINIIGKPGDDGNGNNVVLIYPHPLPTELGYERGYFNDERRAAIQAAVAAG